MYKSSRIWHTHLIWGGCCSTGAINEKSPPCLSSVQPFLLQFFFLALTLIFCMISLSSLLTAKHTLCHLSSSVCVNPPGPARQNLLPESLCILRKRGQTRTVLTKANLQRSAVQWRFQPQSLCYCFPSVKWSNRYLMYQKQFVQQFFPPIQGCAWLAEGSPYLSEANPFSHCAPTLSFYSWGALRLHAGPEMGPQSQWPLGVCVGKCAEQMLKSL